MKLDNKLIKQVGRFAVVGVINTGVDLLVLNLLIAATRSGRSGWTFTLFSSISFLVATANSYLMNKYWTFSGAGTSNRKIEVSEFLIVSTFGLVINVTVASLVVNLIAPGLFPLLPFVRSHLAIWPSIGKLCGTAVGLVFNFIGYKLVVFEKKK